MHPLSSLQIGQPREGYRLSLEPFLLASFADLRGEERGIDLGTGSGIVALLLARRYPDLRLAGIEIQEELVAAARRNVAENALESRVEIRHGDLRRVREIWPAASFDVAVSNPPYRRLHAGRLNPDPSKATARHEIAMSLVDVLEAGRHLLRRRGRLFLIYSPVRLLELAEGCRQRDLSLKRLRFVHGRPGKEAAMVLAEAVKNGREELRVSPPLLVCEETGEYTAEVAAVYSAFGG